MTSAKQAYSTKFERIVERIYNSIVAYEERHNIGWGIYRLSTYFLWCTFMAAALVAGIAVRLTTGSVGWGLVAFCVSIVIIWKVWLIRSYSRGQRREPTQTAKGGER